MFRIRCWYCQKPVSNEIRDRVFFRAIAVCPECIEKSPENKNHPVNEDGYTQAEIDNIDNQ